MANLLSLIPRMIKAKGAKPSEVNLNALPQYLLDDELKLIPLLDDIPKLRPPSAMPTLLYPGCGADILFPLFYIEKMFPELQEIMFIFIDKDSYLSMIKTTLDDLNINFTEQKEEIQFFWKRCFIKLKFLQNNIFTMVENLPVFNIYFERAFRIMRSNIDQYEEVIFSKLAEEGLIISDNGFAHFPLHRIPCPPRLSSYGGMVIGIKSSKV